MKIKKDPTGLIQNASVVGVADKCHVFRDLFDFTAESEFETLLRCELNSAVDNFNEEGIENVSRMISESEIHWNTFCIPPYTFTHTNLPLSSRDIRSNLKVSPV